MIHTSFDVLKPVFATAQFQGDAHFTGVCTDTRQLQAGSLFVALRGERFDAHEFLAQVAQSPVAAVMVEHLPEGFPLPAIVVPDTRLALGELARFWRSQFTLPVIAVTGSNGKTTVKGMIASILQAAFGEGHFLATQGNFNNDIGVPLTLLRLAPEHRAAVIEMGMNHPGEIAYLAGLVQPDVALVNNAQREHQEFMSSVEAVARENGTVIRNLKADGIAVFPADEAYTPLWQEFAAQREVFRFGPRPEGEVWGSAQTLGFGSEVQIYTRFETCRVQLAVAGDHNVRNALAATAAGLAIGLSLKVIGAGLERFVPVAGRLQKKMIANGKSDGAVLIDDTYNANPDSVRAAIKVLAAAPSPRILVLGDMGEVGKEGVQFHREVGEFGAAHGIDTLLTLGDLSAHASAAFGASARHSRELEDLKAALMGALSPEATVLVKGSRFMKMERVVEYLLGEPAQEQEAH